MLGILGGFVLLLVSFYILYLGSTVESTLLTIGGVVIGCISAVVILICRMKCNMNLLEIYKAALRELKKNPQDSALREKAYQAGVDYYKDRRDNRKLLPYDEHRIQQDILRVTKK
ncbi:hypothetical protein QBE52_07170 [Clostridiaceae bacterium 35-E11]